jgi:hypothetical protein
MLRNGIDSATQINKKTTKLPIPIAMGTFTFIDKSLYLFIVD